MKLRGLNSIPQLTGLAPNERNALVNKAYKSDRSLRTLNLLNGMIVGLCYPLAIVVTEWFLGYRSLLRSLPVCFVLAALVSFFMTRILIYPRIRKALEEMEMQSIEPVNPTAQR